MLRTQRLKQAYSTVEYSVLAYEDESPHESLKMDAFKNDSWCWYFDDGLKVLNLAIRGSNELQDWFKNFSIFPTRLKGVGLVHRGFLSSARAILPYITDKVLNAHENNYKIILTGHSYGGAVAQILQQLFLTLNIETFVVSYGAPRVWFAGAKPVVNHLRVQIDSDPVTKMPFVLGLVFRIYKHKESYNFEVDNGNFLNINDHSVFTYRELLNNEFLKDERRKSEEFN